MPADLHVAVDRLLRLAGQRYTTNRRAVVAVLAGAGRPLTIAEVLEAGHRLAQSSVYRNLAVLEEAGVVHRVAGGDEFARYELAEDLTDHHHHHLICSSCGAVADFTVSPQLERSLQHAFDKVAGDTGFHPERHRLDLVGTCAACA